MSGIEKDYVINLVLVEDGLVVTVKLNDELVASAKNVNHENLVSFANDIIKKWGPECTPKRKRLKKSKLIPSESLPTNTAE
jgi:hypothetical protein